MFFIGEPNLADFYAAYIEWVRDGAPESHDTFHRSHGLCSNFAVYANQMSDPLYKRLVREMIDSFIAEGLHERFPFNEGSSISFRDEVWKNALHKNPLRIDFALRHAQRSK